MLPSSGYFKTIPCPFYKNGLCERPYCHFKHVKPEKPSESSLLSEVNVSKPSGLSSSLVLDSGKDDLLGMVTNALHQMQQVVLRETEKRKSEYQSTSATGNASYKPTPLPDSRSHVAHRQHHVRSEMAKKSSIPAYNPTPISRLKRTSSAREKCDWRKPVKITAQSPARAEKIVEKYLPQRTHNLGSRSHAKYVPSSVVHANAFASNSSSLSLPKPICAKSREQLNKASDQSQVNADVDEYDPAAEIDNKQLESVPKYCATKKLVSELPEQMAPKVKKEPTEDDFSEWDEIQETTDFVENSEVTDDNMDMLENVVFSQDKRIANPFLEQSDNSSDSDLPNVNKIKEEIIDRSDKNDTGDYHLSEADEPQKNELIEEKLKKSVGVRESRQTLSMRGDHQTTCKPNHDSRIKSRFSNGKGNEILSSVLSVTASPAYKLDDSDTKSLSSNSNKASLSSVPDKTSLSFNKHNNSSSPAVNESSLSAIGQHKDSTFVAVDKKFARCDEHKDSSVDKCNGHKDLQVVNSEEQETDFKLIEETDITSPENKHVKSSSGDNHKHTVSSDKYKSLSGSKHKYSSSHDEHKCSSSRDKRKHSSSHDERKISSCDKHKHSSSHDKRKYSSGDKHKNSSSGSKDQKSYSAEHDHLVISDKLKVSSGKASLSDENYLLADEILPLHDDKEVSSVVNASIDDKNEHSLVNSKYESCLSRDEQKHHKQGSPSKNGKDKSSSSSDKRKHSLSGEKHEHSSINKKHKHSSSDKRKESSSGGKHKHSSTNDLDKLSTSSDKQKTSYSDKHKQSSPGNKLKHSLSSDKVKHSSSSVKQKHDKVKHSSSNVKHEHDKVKNSSSTKHERDKHEPSNTKVEHDKSKHSSSVKREHDKVKNSSSVKHEREKHEPSSLKDKHDKDKHSSSSVKHEHDKVKNSSSVKHEREKCEPSTSKDKHDKDKRSSSSVKHEHEKVKNSSEVKHEYHKMKYSSSRKHKHSSSKKKHESSSDSASSKEKPVHSISTQNTKNNDANSQDVDCILVDTDSDDEKISTNQTKQFGPETDCVSMDRNDNYSETIGGFSTKRLSAAELFGTSDDEESPSNTDCKRTCRTVRKSNLFEKLTKTNGESAKPSDRVKTVGEVLPSSSSESEKEEEEKEVGTNIKRYEDNAIHEISSDSDGNECVNLLSDFESSDVNVEDHDTFAECLKIFQEEEKKPHDQKPQTSNKVTEKFKKPEIQSEIPRRQRKAHLSMHNTKLKSATPTKNASSHLSPAEVMHNRFAQLQKAAEEARAASVEKAKNISKAASNTVFGSTVNGASAGRKRTAHVAFSSATNVTNKPGFVRPKDRIVAQTHAKGAERKSHLPTVATLKRPTIPSEYGNRVPSNVRQRYLNIFIDEFLKVFDEETAFTQGLEEEKVVYERSSTKNVYLNVAVNTLKRVRNEITDPQSSLRTKTSKTAVDSPTKPPAKKIKHSEMLNGKLATTTTYTLNRSRRPTLPDKFTECELYHRLQPYILSQSQLAENGYPLQSPDKTGCAITLKEETKKHASNDETERLCCRCGKTYRMTSKGKYITHEECIYHWGKPRKSKLGGAWVTRYDCCQGESNLDGCCVAKLHVHDTKNLSGFVHTMPRTPPTDGNCGVYALDCEMGYTTEGFELTRVTVVSPSLEPVFETLVKPDHPIIDYNTRFSGITESDMAGVTMTLRDVQAILLNRFNSQTILIGHSLESDLLALKIIHQTVVDTSIVFPHRLGPPYKRALRNLMAECVKKIIQQNVNGHDSQEDANACMELMIWKLKEDAKLGTALPLFS